MILFNFNAFKCVLPIEIIDWLCIYFKEFEDRIRFDKKNILLVWYKQLKALLINQFSRFEKQLRNPSSENAKLDDIYSYYE